MNLRNSFQKASRQRKGEGRCKWLCGAEEQTRENSWPPHPAAPTSNPALLCLVAPCRASATLKMAPESSTVPDEGRFYYQLVIRIFKGRLFPSTHDEGGKHIALEARFNGESLSTDPVELCSEPVFNTELVWEFGAAKHRQIKEREGSTLRLQCVLAGEDTAQAGAKLVGFAMLDLRSYASSVIPQGRQKLGAVAAAKIESRWYQLRGARRPLPEIKIFIKINCKPIISLVSGPPMPEDMETRSPGRSPRKGARRVNVTRRTAGQNENDDWEKHKVGLHGTVLLPPQRVSAGQARHPGAWGRYTLVVKCKSIFQEQMGIRSTVPLEGAWSLLLGIAGRMYAIHAPKIPASALAPEFPGPELGAVHEVFAADASSLGDFLERSDGRGGGIALWLFINGMQVASGTVGLGQLAGAVGRTWKEGEIDSMATSVRLLNTWVPSRLDDAGGTSPAAEGKDEQITPVASVELDIDLFGIGSGPQLPVPVPEFEQQVPCSLAITIISLCLHSGLPLGVHNVQVKCNKSSGRMVGESIATPLHLTQSVSLNKDGIEGAEGKHIGVGEMFTMAGAWGDVRQVRLEFDLADADEERLLAAGVVDIGTAISSDRSPEQSGALSAVAGAMHVRTVALVDQAGNSRGRLSVMLSCNLSLDFPQVDPDAVERDLSQAEREMVIHGAQRVALVCEAAPEGGLDVNRDMAISVDLQAVRALTNANDTIFLRYSLPVLGYLPPVLTAPPVFAERHGPVALGSYNAYEVVLTYRELATALAEPIRIEVWSKEKYAKDRLIALADLHLWYLFASLPGSANDAARRRMPAHEREWAGVLTAFAVEEESARSAEKLGVGAVELITTKRKLFAISVGLTFADKGPTGLNPVSGDKGRTPDPASDEKVRPPAESASGQTRAQDLAATPDSAPVPSASEAAPDTRSVHDEDGASDAAPVSAAGGGGVRGTSGGDSGVPHDAGTMAPSRAERMHSDSGKGQVAVARTWPSGRHGGKDYGTSVHTPPENDRSATGREAGRAGRGVHYDGVQESWDGSGRRGWGEGGEASLQIREQEEAVLAALEAEFRRQEEHRERVAARKLAELAQLETSLKNCLHEVERRERRLELAEEEAQVRRRQEAALAEQRRAELQEARKRMREEMAHDASMAEARRNDALQQLKDERNRLKESEERNGRLEAEIQKLRSAARNASESSLMVEVAQLRAKNEELLDRLQRSEEQHVLCKEQLAKALTRLRCVCGMCVSVCARAWGAMWERVCVRGAFISSFHIQLDEISDPNRNQPRLDLHRSDRNPNVHAAAAISATRSINAKWIP
jgi:hypothetical protein